MKRVYLLPKKTKHFGDYFSKEKNVGQSSFVPGPAETQVRAESNLLSAKFSFVTFYAKIFVLEVRFRKDTDSDNITCKKYHIVLFVKSVNDAL
jgi:hypothetical protein